MFRPDKAVGEAASSAADFSRDAPRYLWGVQILAAIGVALVFVSMRGLMSAKDSSELFRIGWWTILVTAAPLWAGLYRLELGGKARRDLGLAGLQFGMPELRIIALGAAFVAAAAMVFLPIIALSALSFVFLRFAGSVALGPLGEVQVSFLIAAALWLAGVAGFIWLCGRCAFATPATVGKRRLVAVEAWEMGVGDVGSVLWTWLLAQTPLLLTFALLALVDSVELDSPVAGLRSRWPLLDASVAGLVLGCVCTFVQAPMTVGVLGYLYRARQERMRVFTARPTRRYRPELLPIQGAKAERVRVILRT